MDPGRPRKSLSERVLHFVGRDRSIVCRCANPDGHYLKTMSVAKDSKHLSASLTLYMDRFGFESCKIAKFNTFQAQQKAVWKMLGINIDEFHYADEKTGLVCRCINPGSHSYGIVRNPEIVELCAKFFESNNDKAICSKEEWRGNYFGSYTDSLNSRSLSGYDHLQHSAVQEHGFSIRTRRSGSCVPSLCKGSEHGSSSSLSTPIGSSRSLLAPSHRSRASQLDLSDCPRHTSTDRHSSQFQRDASVPNEPSYPRTRISSTHSTYRHTSMLRDTQGHIPTGIAELPDRRTGIPTSRMLEPRARLTSMVKQSHSIDTLPDQEEFLLRHAIVSSRSNPAPRGNCQVCKTSYQNSPHRTFTLPRCGHLLHEKCLLTSFRDSDQGIGTCPLCSREVCTRTLADRIDTDRHAIFNSGFTQLREAVKIEFPQYGQTVTCNSEEEVAAAQLRLLKDYIDVHAEELYEQWERTHDEPNWYAGVIQPVVKLFEGWNLPRESKFFARRREFLELVACAELVRLVNTTRIVIKNMNGQDTPYPRLATLHNVFNSAKSNFDKEKKKWQTDRVNVSECEKVAHVMVQIARNAQAL